MKLLNDPTIDATARFLDYLSAREKIIANNIANIDTPGYRVKDLTFYRELISLSGRKEFPGATLMEASGPLHFRVVDVEGLQTKPDGNNVNLDREMAKLSETALQYATMVQMLVKKFKILHEAATEGRQA